MKAVLTKGQIKQAWDYAKVINGVDPKFVRMDCLGAMIHFDEYDMDTEYGWCAEYVLSQEVLSNYGINNVNLFNEANIRILHIGNYNENIGHRIGQYSVKYKYVKAPKRNLRQNPNNISEINRLGVDELKRLFTLSDQQVSDIFKDINIID